MSKFQRHPIIAMLIITTFFVACGAESESPSETRPGRGMGPGMGRGMGEGMGPGSGMRERHQARVPSEYAGLTNPVDATEDSLARGEEIYTTYCETCHGEDGMGNGPSGESLDPAPAPVAHTSQMLGDAYLFWRISEGGAMEPFNSAMPAWKETLAEEERWDVINYIRALQ